MTTATPHDDDGASASSERDALAGALAAVPVPPLDADLSARTLRRARGELLMRGERTLSLAGLVALWDASLVPAIVLLTGASYGVLAVARMIEIFT